MKITRCDYKPMSRVGLYIMVFIILLHSCDINFTNHNAVMDKLNKIEKKVELIEKRIEPAEGDIG